eukprot:5276564-Pleurochrysis_carterae.AAC.2
MEIACEIRSPELRSGEQRAARLHQLRGVDPVRVGDERELLASLPLLEQRLRKPEKRQATHAHLSDR